MLLALPSATAAAVPAQQVAPTVVQTVAITPTPSRSDLLVSEAEWTWSELRDYVVSQIEQRFGAFPRDSRKEYGIFTRFAKEYGAEAVAIAKYAFEVTEGWWQGAPISVNRFCKGSDPFFAEPIRARLADIA